MPITLQEQQSILATAKKSTHYQLRNNPLWFRIVSVSDAISFKIHGVEPLDKSAKPAATFPVDVQELNSVNDISFAKIEAVELVEVGATQCEMVLDELLSLKQQLLDSIKMVDLVGIKKNIHDIGSLLRYHKGGYSDNPYDWYNKQGCPITTGATVIALCDGFEESFARLNKAATRYNQIPPAFANVPRWMEMIDLVIIDLAAVVARKKASGGAPKLH